MKTITEKTTHIEAVRTVNRSQIDQVCHILQWSHQQYCENQYYQYENYLSRAFFDLPKVLNKLRHSPEFRGFWNNQWIKRNATDFLPFAQQVIEPEFEFNEEGKFEVIEPIPLGDAYLQDEYGLIHSHFRLFDDDEFILAYNHTIDLIINKL